MLTRAIQALNLLILLPLIQVFCCILLVNFYQTIHFRLQASVLQSPYKQLRSQRSATDNYKGQPRQTIKHTKRGDLPRGHSHSLDLCCGYSLCPPECSFLLMKNAQEAYIDSRMCIGTDKPPDTRT